MQCAHQARSWRPCVTMRETVTEPSETKSICSQLDATFSLAGSGDQKAPSEQPSAAVCPTRAQKGDCPDSEDDADRW